MFKRVLILCAMIAVLLGWFNLAHAQSDQKKPPSDPEATPAIATLPPLSFNLNGASLSETVAALNKAMDTGNRFIAETPDVRGVRFSLRGKMTFGQAICVLHAQHPLRIARVTDNNKVKRISLGTTTLNSTLTDAGTAISQIRVVVRTHRLPSGPPSGTFNTQPSFEWDIFFDPRLKVKAFTEPKLVEFTDEQGKDALSKTWQAEWPPSGEFEEYHSNIPRYSGSIGWPQAITAVKWTMRVKIADPTAPRGTVERTITGEAKDIAVPPRGTPGER